MYYSSVSRIILVSSEGSKNSSPESIEGPQNIYIWGIHNFAETYNSVCSLPQIKW